MSAQEYGEDFFSDDDLDTAAFDELENNAIQATQAQTQALRAAPQQQSSDYGAPDLEGDDLDDAVVVDEARSTPSIIPILQKNGVAQAQERFRSQEDGVTQSATQSQRKQIASIPPRQTIPYHPSPSIPRDESMRAQQGSQVDTSNLGALQKQIQEVLLQSLSSQPGICINSSSFSKSAMPSNKTCMRSLVRFPSSGASRRQQPKPSRKKSLPSGNRTWIS